MKNLSMVLAIAALAVGSVSCSVGEINGSLDGQPSCCPVIFGTEMRRTCPKDAYSLDKAMGFRTRAAYSGETNASTGKERIDWEEGDVIHIAADKSSGAYAADYEITGVSHEGSGSYGRISPLDAGSRLFWGSRDEHHFHAFYNTDAAGADYEGLHEKGFLDSSIPGVQSADPARNAASELEMFSSVSAKPSDGSVRLVFQPSVTTFQISLENGFYSGRSMKVQRVELESAGDDPRLWGAIRYAVDDGTGAVSAGPAPALDDISRNVLSANLGNGIWVESGESLTVTLFALPKDITALSLRVKVNGREAAVKLGRTVDGVYEPIVFESCSKNNLHFTLAGYPFEEVDFDPLSPEFIYFNMTPLEGPATITARHDVHYSTDLSEWTFLPKGGSIEGLEAGTTVYFKNDGTEFRSGGANVVGYPEVGGALYCSTHCDVAGNVMSLLKGDDFYYEDSLEDKYAFKGLFYSSRVVHADRLVIPVRKMTAGALCYMFARCVSLLTPPRLPAEEMAPHCCYWMFEGCSKLGTAPQLPAMKLAPNCYESMFMYCTSLPEPPDLPATVMEKSCYSGMFKSCVSIKDLSGWSLPSETLAERCYFSMFMESGVTDVPSLPATTLSPYCYANMFYSCYRLTDLSALELPSAVMAPYCYVNMFYDCSALVLPPRTLPATTLAGGCYEKMFMYCRKLQKAPVLPAPVLEYSCYNSMFNFCNSLSYIQMLATDISAAYCLNKWVGYVSSTGTFVKSADASWSVTGRSGIPNGWTVETLPSGELPAPAGS